MTICKVCLVRYRCRRAKSMRSKKTIREVTSLQLVRDHSFSTYARFPENLLNE